MSSQEIYEKLSKYDGTKVVFDVGLKAINDILKEPDLTRFETSVLLESKHQIEVRLRHIAKTVKDLEAQLEEEKAKDAPALKEQIESRPKKSEKKPAKKEGKK